MNGDMENHLTTKDLIEQASLDALGLLDIQERRAFERAFAAAPDSLQAQLRREQQRYANQGDLLPNVEPDSSLRSRVLAAVTGAISAMSPAHERDVLAKISAGTFAMRANVTPLWRAACIGFASAIVVLMTVGYSVQRDWQESADAYRNGETASELQSFGGRFVEVFLSPSTQRVALAPMAEDAAGSAVIMVDPQSEIGMLICRGLPEVEGDVEYRLVLCDESGEVLTTLASFQTKGELINTSLNHNQFEGGKRFDLRRASRTSEKEAGEIVMTSTI